MASNFYNPNMAGNFHNPCFGQIRINDEELRIVMVGKIGMGKSATGNTILGRNCFESKFSSKSMTVDCSKGKGTVDGQKVAVIDTPGLFDTRFGINKTAEDISQCITYASPGPHVFLVVIRLGRYTGEEKQTVQMIQEIFGQAADRYSMVLFTGGDQLEMEETTIEDFLAKSPDLQQLVARCKGQYHVFNNKQKKDRSQVTVLLQKIRNIVQKNGGSHYTNQMFQEAERALKEEKQRILEEEEEQMPKEIEKLEREIQHRMKRLQADGERERKEREEKRKKEKLEMSEKRDREERQAGRGTKWEETEILLHELQEQHVNNLGMMLARLERCRGDPAREEAEERTERLQKRNGDKARKEAEDSNLLYILVNAGDSITEAGQHVARRVTALGKAIWNWFK